MRKGKWIFIVVIVLAVIVIILVLSDRSTTLDSGSSVFAVEDTASVSRIFLADMENNTVLLERKDQGQWILNGKYKAHPFQVNDMLRTMRELKVKTPVPRAARNNVIARLSASGIKVEIYQIKPLIGFLDLFPREKLTKVYYVGDATQDNLGTFMKMEGYDDPYVVFIPSFRGFVAPRYSTNEDDWRDHTVFNTPLRKLQSVSLEFMENPEESFTINRTQDDEFVLYLTGNGLSVPYDTLRMLNFLSSFGDLRFEAVLTNSLSEDYIDSIRNTRPAHILTLVNTDNDTNSIITYRKKGFSEVYDDTEGLQLVPFDLDRLYAVVNDGQDFVLLQYFVFDKALRSASYLQGLTDRNPIPVTEPR